MAQQETDIREERQATNVSGTLESVLVNAVLLTLTKKFEPCLSKGSMTPEEVDRRIQQFLDPDNRPAPEICPYCGKELVYPPLMVHGEFVAWNPGDPLCDCEEAAEAECQRIRTEKEAERARREHEADMAFSYRATAYLGRSIMHKRFADKTLDSFKADTAMRKRSKSMIEHYLAGYAGMEKKGLGLYIWGSNGTGKTHLALALCKALRENGFHRILPKTVSEMFADIRACYEPGGPPEAEVIELYKNARVLILDDLGKEKASDWSMEKLFDIVNARYLAMRPMVITSNYRLGDVLIGRLTVNRDAGNASAIVSRLNECTVEVHMDSADMRDGRVS